MSETTSSATSTRDVREAIVKRAQLNDSCTVSTIENDVSQELGCADARVVDELDKLERNGFIYLVDDGGEELVKLP
jgi:hypothetical protein